MGERLDFTASYETPWPKSGDLLIQSGEDWHMNACLNFADDHVEGYATGYKLAAEILVERVDQTNRDQDRLVYPILFNYRHYVELRLKLIIRNACRLLDEEPRTPAGHKLDLLWTEARPLIERCYPNDPKSDLDLAQDLILQFVAADPRSDGFRYSTDRSGNPNLKDITHINLRNVYEVVGRLAGMLDSIDLGIVCETDAKESWESEMRRYYDPGPYDGY